MASAETDVVLKCVTVLFAAVLAEKETKTETADQWFRYCLLKRFPVQSTVCFDLPGVSESSSFQNPFMLFQQVSENAFMRPVGNDNSAGS